jgi:PiT family inorganic phosphate transporter
MALAFIADLPAYASVLFIVCLISVCLFEAINGFHDTANAVATVIYTRSLPPIPAVIWSGFWNFLGVILGGITVAMGIIKLIPLNDLMVQSLGENVALVLSILLAAIAWNLGTWYYGIPCSSSHTLIGSLLGGGFAFWTIHHGGGPNWVKAQEIGLSLLISPFFGFSLAILLMYILRYSVQKRKEIFDEPKPKKSPPLWIRAILITTCTLVSFFHGSNDGQKGVGLLLVVLMAFMPLQYAFNRDQPIANYSALARSIETTVRQNRDSLTEPQLEALAVQAGRTASMLDSIDVTSKAQLYQARTAVQSLVKNIDADFKAGLIPNPLKASLRHDTRQLKTAYEFAPRWAIILISLCLGIGTMFGWKRIVVTIGEKIGKTHLTYAQGASAELCAAATIGVATASGLPVSTTHVLSSGVTGTMVASGGIKNLQKNTIKNIGLAWVLTLPVTFALAAGLFYLFRLLF